MRAPEKEEGNKQDKQTSTIRAPETQRKGEAIRDPRSALWVPGHVEKNRPYLWGIPMDNPWWEQ